MSLTALFAPANSQQKVFTIGSTSFRMITLPGKEGFWMGEDESARDSEKPRHQRDIAPFALAEFLVTQQLWEAVVAKGLQHPQARTLVQGHAEEQTLPLNPAYFRGKNRPVEYVNWHEARRFCAVLSMLTVGKPDFFRLPSEAEWEYAARTGARETVYAGSNQLGEVAWHDGNNEKETMPVGLLLPNAFGLYDLSGNVWEWCEDDWHDDYKNHPGNSAAWKDGETEEARASLRVLRGGSWDYVARNCRCANRYWFRPGNRGRYYGFRLAAPVSDSV
ncbi:formylglycine-generating enzyme family protein [Neolewinella persica]|uniref:formylglycine-generating enzyme family protein n=1 Tax=Neolewinella persica TaxID=70998 RepID=UPI0003792713|nr:formylglycine-generating enzyme family protein [Neolewinella persica]